MFIEWTIVSKGTMESSKCGMICIYTRLDLAFCIGEQEFFAGQRAQFEIKELSSCLGSGTD